MFLIVGLGNHGDKYKGTRHNVGFMVVDQIFNNQFSIFQLNKPLKAEIAKGKIDDQEIVLAKPVTFMNESGVSVKKLITNYQLPITDWIIIHDDITLELGTIKISKGAGAGNHNGVQSVIDRLKTKDFIRVRCGIGRGNGILHDVVLSKFTKDEREIVQKMVEKAAEVCVAIVKDGLETAMNRYN